MQRTVDAPAANVRIAQKAETRPLVTPSTGYLERHAFRVVLLEPSERIKPAR
jgi:hypothetical protein